LLNATGAFAKKPDWVKKRPHSKIYFVGLGLAQKSGINREYIQTAKNNALSDLSSEITVNISSEFITRVVEQYGMVEEEVKSEIRASTEASLEGFELVDTWEDKNEYWVYYRLRRDLYYQQKQAKIERAMSRSLDLFDKGKVNEENKNISEALSFYLQSLAPIQSHIDEPLETQYRGSKIYLLNEIFSSVQSFLSKVPIILRPRINFRGNRVEQQTVTPIVELHLLFQESHPQQQFFILQIAESLPVFADGFVVNFLPKAR